MCCCDSLKKLSLSNHEVKKSSHYIIYESIGKESELDITGLFYTCFYGITRIQHVSQIFCVNSWTRVLNTSSYNMTRTIMMSKKKEPTYNTNVLIHLRNTDDIIRRKNNHHLKLSLGFFRLSQSGLYWMLKKCKIQYVLRLFSTLHCFTSQVPWQ